MSAFKPGRRRAADRDQGGAAADPGAQDRRRAAAGRGELDGLLPRAPRGLGLALREMPVTEGGLVVRRLLVVAGVADPRSRVVQLRLRLAEPSELGERHRLLDRELGQAALVVETRQDLERLRVRGQRGVVTPFVLTEQA